MMIVKNKIRLLMCLVETYEINKSRGAEVTSEQVFNVLFTHFSKQAMDKVWFNSVFQSFKRTVLTNKSLPIWIAAQLRPLSLFEASDSFQKSPEGISDLHCLSFAYSFLGNKPDNYFCNYSNRINDRVAIYLEQNAQITSEENLKPGDIIAYKNKDKQWTHVGVYIGRVNDENYVISKFGKTFNVFFHPLNGVPEDDETAYCYSSLNLSHVASANLNLARRELQNRILPSVPVLQGILSNTSSTQTEEFQPTDKFEFYAPEYN